ncbi:acyl-CoA thioesterase [Desulfobacca acetoxidans]|uniref:4-hydroxybenzoyl-CoA thioesterase n=1 Tax=Desulfobacca acetoxidans (strain ATCC 700848 / DSM 11109 / ASRB2) TaxID=880072 RepID=F2NJA9_DESAR|nr:thioesterase family protein [Desulfobacca acetoxidans]AEB09281.1 4-hydroxybenzoyl-CoA thioesterase [Desulfobacca acetoxidans DSM 11109]
MAGKGHRFSYRIPLFEVDMGQAVYHGNYFHLFELAREQLLRDLGFGYPELVARQIHLAVVEAHCRYRQPVRYDDQIDIITVIPSLKSRGVQFQQQLFLTATRKLATEVRLTTISIDFSGKPVPLPPELRQKLVVFID